MNWSLKHKLMLCKMVLDVGYNETAYLKWALGATGLASNDPKFTATLFGVYGVVIILVGAIYLKFGWMDVRNDLNNHFNPLMRKLDQTLK